MNKEVEQKLDVLITAIVAETIAKAMGDDSAEPAKHCKELKEFVGALLEKGKD